MAQPISKFPELISGNARKPIYSYGVAVLSTGLALALTLAFPNVETQPIYFLFIAAVVVASWYGGWKPGLVSLLLSGVELLTLVWLPHSYHTGPGANWRFIAFMATATLVWGLTSALHHTMESLHWSSIHFGGVVQLSEDAIISVDESQKITLFNPGAEHIFGYPAGEILGRSINELLPERYRQMHAAHIGAFMSSPDSLRPMNARGTIYGLRKDGTEFPAEASISKFRMGSENVMTVRMRDVTESQVAERGLRQLAAIVESSDDAIVGLSLDGVITSLNPGAERLYGRSSSVTVGWQFSSLVATEYHAEVTSMLESIRNGNSFKDEAVHVREDGRKINVALTVSPIKDKNGKVVGASVVGRDVTDRKSLEEQLRQSQKMEAIGRLAGGIAHDFNNLLSIIVGYTYMILSGTSENDSARGQAEQVMKAAERASSLTRQLLAFSRKQVLQPEVLDINELINGMNKMLLRLIREDIDVLTTLSDKLMHVRADRGQIEQIILNLVVNARDAMPDGGQLTIETGNISFLPSDAMLHGVKPGDYVMLGVSDTGQGMDAETQSHLFEPFFTTKAPGEGTGLGLATVYAIVDQNGGYISVYSELDHGTTFKVYLPSSQSPSQPGPSEQRQTKSLQGSETVLVVEDEQAVRALVSQVLSEMGYSVLAAENGALAIDLFQKHPGRIQLLLTDVVMPGMRGQEIAIKLRAQAPNLKIVYMSGYTDRALIHHGVLEPGTVFLQKPFTPDTLLRKIRDVLDAGDAPEQLREKAG